VTNWSDPRLWISFALIGLFGYAYVREPSELLEGALIAGFSTAYGFWLGSSKGNQSATENTRAAFDTIKAVAGGQATGKADDPLHVVPEDSK
jgi:hypothetical protein